MTANIHEPRSDVIRRHVNNFFRIEKAATEENFSDEVKGIYHDRVPIESDRVIAFHDGGDAGKMLAANAQIIFRIFKGKVKFPADIEEAVVLALPEPYQADCKAELAERYDMLPAYISHVRPDKSIVNIATLLKEFGETVEALAPMLADGKIDKDDAHLAKKALKETHDLQGVLHEITGQIVSILPEDDAVDLKVVKS